MHSKRNPEGYIDFEQAHMCAKDQDIDVMLRSKYVELILVMFVDVGNNRPFLDNLCYSFVSTFFMLVHGINTFLVESLIFFFFVFFFFSVVCTIVLFPSLTLLFSLITTDIQ